MFFVRPIPLTVSHELCLPVFLIPMWDVSVDRTEMPEATIDKYGNLLPCKYNVRTNSLLTRYDRQILPETVPSLVKKGP